MTEFSYLPEHKGPFQKGYLPPDLQLINRLEDLIETHFKIHKEAAFYCKELAVTERMMNGHLKFHRNMTVFQVIRTRVLKEADSLLSYSNMTIQEISYELGIDDPGYFSRIFKETRGMKPKEYRNRNLRTARYSEAI